MTRGLDLRGVRVLVTNAETRLGLWVIRSLGRAGCRVTAVCNKPLVKRPLGFASRYASQREVFPQAHESEQLAALQRLSDDHDVLVPVSNWSQWKVAQYQHEFSARIPSYIPSFESLKTATNKATTTRIAEEAGLPVPRSFHNLEPETVEEWARDIGISFPLVVKFAEETRKSMWRPEERYSIVHSLDEFAREYRRMHEIGPFPQVQEYIKGGGFGFFAITDSSGNPVATFCHRRLREYPISGGPSTLCESFHDPTLVRLGGDLLRAMKWRGVAMVEFKQNAETGVYHFLEINPRFSRYLKLMLSDRRLAALCSALDSIGHVRRLRVHTRLPIVLPERMTDELLALFGGLRMTAIFVVHANHPNEIAGDCAGTLRTVVRSGLTVLNQSVLLKGINDTADVLAELSERLVDLGVLPYYLHQLDRVAGAAHFEVPEAVGAFLIAELRRRLPGYAVPRFVRETPGESHKLPLFDCNDFTGE